MVPSIGFSRHLARAYHPGRGPPASVSQSLLCYAPPNEPSTPPAAHRGTTNTEHSPKRHLSLVRNWGLDPCKVTILAFIDLLLSLSHKKHYL